ncbi:hypothetical protein M413DRAFT_448956 [Hebeloma cylindrosporum]|uniref:Uncharacterized protein n=1 Tax=Hebeloma cylindrosporum TaxID=76867 RepID=A0A0C2Y723_HEBCY|nr:hypothetical protein M413DRAFT_448956 [Hebeloma cylindrosporum h7]
MPRTRNVTRAQWDTANASHGSSARNRNENENGDESEKENARGSAGMAARLRSAHTTSSRRRVLGATTSTTVLGDSKGIKSSDKKAAKKSRTLTAPKRKKLPLQDITAQFLPAPEAANRGAEHQGHSDDEEEQMLANVLAALPPALVNTRTAPALTSPLPPSSPPSDLQFSPPPKVVGVPFAVSPTHSIPHDEYNPWKEFDNAISASNDVLSGNDSNSDPFGFVALERKLKAERAHIPSDPDHGEEELPGFGNVLVADTSSPRPVRRLKRPVEHESDADEEPEEVVQHAHFATPPTPHKDKQKRRRLSHEGHDVFSVCSGSIESSPSPSKVSARARPRADIPEDPLDEFNDKVDRSFEVEVASEDKKRTRVRVDPEAVAMNLRKRERLSSQAGPSQVNHDDKKKPKSASKVKATKKPTRKTTKKEKEKEPENEDDEEDLDEKWERERQERIKYFKDLDGYQFEKEDVFVI